MDYKLVRSIRRKTVSLQVKQGQVTVRAPHYVSDDDIEKIVNKKSLWLKSKVEQQLKKFATESIEPRVAPFTEGSLLWIRGQQKKLCITFSKSSTTYIHENDIIVVLSERVRRRIINEDQLRIKVKKQLEQFLIEQAESYIPARLKVLSSIIHLFPSHYKIKQYKARWGSCNSRQELSFNYLLMMSPDWVVDYVIVHELCHIKHLNHSANFWLLVQKYYPEYKKAKQWLLERQKSLNWHT